MVKAIRAVGTDSTHLHQCVEKCRNLSNDPLGMLDGGQRLG